jgi:hypothetical protein
MAVEAIENIQAKAQIDFECFDEACAGIVKFNLIDAAKKTFQVSCPKCRRIYEFDGELREKLNKLLKLIIAVREAESILGECNVSVNVPGGEVKVPYALLLTRLNTMITLNADGKKVDFHLWVEPSSPETFR